MASATTPAPDAPAAGRWQGDDFAAWLPPMLVRELRQGVQSGVFFWTFLLLQAAVFVGCALQVVAHERRAQQAFMQFFWVAAGAAVAVIVPLRGLGAIDGERRGNALDLLQLSRLSATRIVAGKWAALVVQAALVAVTLLPYLVLRYYFGGVDVLADLRAVGWLLAAAAVVAAAAIALSTLPVWLRIGVSVASGGIMLVLVVDGPLERTLLQFLSGRGMSAETYAGIIAAVAVYTIACLAFAAARIAPPAENHALRRRLLALGVAAAWPVTGWLGTAEAAVATFLVTAPLLVGFAVGALLEKPSRVRTLFAPFRRAGVLGRAAAAVFTPGWATGFVLVAVLAATCLAGWAGFMERFVAADARPVAIAAAALLGAALVCPLPFTALLPRVRNRPLLYGLVQLICFTVFALANGCKPSSLPWSQYAPGRLVTLPFPLGAAAAFVAGDADQNATRALAPTFMLAGLGVIAAVLAVMARPWLRELALTGRLVRGDIVAGLPAPAVRRRPARADRPWVWRGDDLPGRLSPMLVRELRQGVQSGVFAWTFIGIQGAMFALMTWALGVDGSGEPGRLATRIAVLFWAAIATAIVVVVPLRGLTMVSGERVASNLDLVRLTRLSATRIIVGKWLAVVGQGLLVATTLLPYLVLRYFFGGVNTLVDLEIFSWMVAGSMTVAAAAIALSALPVGARIGVSLAVAAVGFLPVVAVFEQVARGRLSFASLGMHGRLGILAGIGLLTVTLLEYAASKLAPLAENHAGRQRLLAIVIGVVWAAVGVWGPKAAFVPALCITGPLLLCHAIGALLERPVPIATLYRPFGRRGVVGRLAAAVFTPGWATAVPFVAIVAGLFMLGWVVGLARNGSNHEFMPLLTLGCQVVAAVVFPLPLLAWWPRLRQRLAAYAVVQLGCFLVFVFLMAVIPRGVSAREWGGWMFALPFPLAAASAIVASTGSATFIPAFLTASAVTTLVVLAIVAGPWWAEMRRVMRLVRESVLNWEP